VFFIQKMTLVETCLQVGNLDIFFYIIELVTHNAEFTPHQRYILLLVINLFHL